MTNKAKNTQGVQPKLRFPEFSDSWDVPTLGEISDRIVKKVGTQTLETISISAGIGFVSQAKKFSRDISGEQYKNYIVLNKGDFSYNKGNSKRFPQGCVYKLTNFDRVAAPNVFFSFKFKSDYVCDFYKGYFENNFHGEQLSELLEPLDLGWKARTQKELALMEDLIPLLHKLAVGRNISGLNAYEQ